MDESAIEATQALDFGYDDDEEEADNDLPVGFINVPCQKGFAGKLYPIKSGDNVIGRHEGCAVYIPYKGLSREHACVEVKGDAHFIYDKGSRNRTRRNQHFLAASVRYELKHNDTLTFGDLDCTYTIGTQSHDDGDETGSETGSESMIPLDDDHDHGKLDETVQVQEEIATRLLDDVEEDYASDASSDILEPTQPFSANTQSMIQFNKKNGDETSLENKTINVTVEDTPAANRTKRFTLPESDSDDEDILEIPVTPTVLAADSQNDSADSAILGAPTQAYVCDSDASTDDEESDIHKTSILTAATQAFTEDDVSTCSESSPEKRLLLTAATQAYVADSDTESPIKESTKTVSAEPPPGVEATVAYDMMEDGDSNHSDIKESVKRQLLIEPTQAYNMGEAESDTDAETDEPGDKTGASMMFEPTQAYPGAEPDSGDDTDDGDNQKEDKPGSSMMFEPTQAYIGDGDTDVKAADEDDAKSDTSEEFVLDGDTDNEGDTNEDILMAAPTLAMGGDEDYGANADDATQVVDDKAEDDGETQVFTEDATQVFDDAKKSKTTVTKTRPIEDCKTQVFNEDATQVFEEPKATKSKKNTPKKLEECETLMVTEDATQVFDNDDDTSVNKSGKRTSAASECAETQVFTDDSTQVFDEQNKKLKRNIRKSNDNDEGATQVFDDATQAFDDTDHTTKPSESDTDATQVFTNATQTSDRNNKKSKRQTKHTEEVDDQATQVFDNNDIEETTRVFTEEKENIKSSKINERGTKTVKEVKQVDEDATQALSDNEGAESTFDINAAATFDMGDSPVVKKTVGDEVGEKTNNINAVGEDATQVFNQDDETVGIQDIGTLPIEAEGTVALPEIDQTVAVTDNRKNTKAKSSKTREKKKTNTKYDKNTKLVEDATQVFDDETVEVNVEADATVAVSEITEEVPLKRSKRGRVAKKGWDEVEGKDNKSVIEQTVPIENVEESDIKGRRGKTSRKASAKVEPTLEIDQTVAVADIDETEPKTKRGRSGRNVTVAKESKSEDNTKSKRGKTKKDSVADTKAIVEQEEATQVFETGDSETDKDNEECVDNKQINDNITEEATQVFGENLPEMDLVAEKSLIIKGRGKKKLEQTKNEKTMTVDNEEATQVFDDVETETLPIAEVETLERKSGRGKQKKEVVNEKELEGNEEATQVFSGESSDTEPNAQKGTSKRKSGRSRKETHEAVVETKPEDDADQATQVFEEDVPETVQIAENDTSTRRSGRGKQTKKDNAVNETKEEAKGNENSVTTARSKRKRKDEKHTDIDKQENEVKETSGARQSRRGNKSQEKPPVPVDSEPETQMYFDEEQPEAAPQMYIEEDATPSLSQISTDTEESEPVDKPSLVKIPSRSPLKSALASPKKREKSPSPKRVKFISQNSSTGSESSQPSTRTTRGKRSKDGKTDKATTKGTDKQDKDKSAATQQEEPDLTKDTQPARRRATRGNLEVTETKTEDIKQTTKKGRISVDTGTTSKITIESEEKKTRTSLPIVLEEKGGRTSRRGAAKIEATETVNVNASTKNDSEAETNKGRKGGKKGKGAINKEVSETANSDKETVESKDKKEETENTARTSRQIKVKHELNNDNETINEKKTEQTDKEENVVGRNSRSKLRNKDSDISTESGSTSKSKLSEKNVEKASEETEIETNLRGSKRNKSKSKLTVSEESEKSKTEIEKSETEVSENKKSKRQRGSGDSNDKSEETKEDTKLTELASDTATKAGNKSTKGKTKSSSVKEVVVPKEEKEDIPEPSTKKSARGKRKEAQTTDDEKDTQGVTPAKKNKSQPPVNIETPKQTHKKLSAMSTPKGGATNDLDLSITSSPTLRRTTTDGNKAKVMFTGVMDDQGEKIVKELGGELVSSVYDCTHLVTDQIRRTVKFLCCLSRGIPIVSPQWLVSSKRSGFFSDPGSFLIRDDSSEKKFKLSLARSLDKAATGALLTGYKIHVTKSVKPDPAQMKDIVQCAGAEFLTSLPKTLSANTVVISCQDDQSVCTPAVKSGLPVVTAEFILTGILRQEVDIQSYLLFNSGSSSGSNGNASKRQSTSVISTEPASKRRKR